MKNKFVGCRLLVAGWLLLVLATCHLQPTTCSAATQPNDIRFQQFDGLQWNWVEVRPIDAGALTFDGSLQFAVESAKQPLLTGTSSIVGSNATLNGFLSLSGRTNHFTDSASQLQRNGTVIGPLSASDNISVSNVTASGYLKLSGKTNQIGDNGTALTFNGTAIGDTIWTNDNDYYHLIQSGDRYAFGSSSIGPTTSSTEIYAYGNNSLHSATITNSQDVYAFGNYALASASLTNANNIYAYGDDDLDGSTIADSGEIYTFGNYALGAGSVTGSQRIYAFGDGGLSSATIVDSFDIHAVGRYALKSAALTNSSDVYAIGTSAGENIAGSFTNVVLIGKNATATSGDANLAIFGPDISLRVKGHTGLTTTNTFYTVDSGLTSTITNVVVIQGGIVTSWSVTP